MRFLGNRSSGKQGYALAAAAAARGAPRSTLVAANVALPDPAGVDVVRVGTARAAAATRCVAAADGRRRRRDGRRRRRLPARRRSPTTRSRRPTPGPSPTPIALVRNPDILAGLVAARDAAPAAPVIVGFAAETGDDDGDVLDHARAKLARKGCDLLVVNDGRRRRRPSRPTDNEAVILARRRRRRRRAARGSQGRASPTPSGTRVAAPAGRRSDARSMRADAAATGRVSTGD